MCPDHVFTVPQSAEGARLDRVLAEIMPDSGLRLRRRLCDDLLVTVDGRHRKAGYKVRSGQCITISEPGENHMTTADLGIHVVKQVGMFAAVYKPGGVHSASIAGKAEPCVEAVLPELFPDAEPVLLNRLDHLTSGLLLVALNPDGQKAYAEMEDKGDIRKYYLAEVRGRFDGFACVKRQLDTDDRKQTKILDEDDTDSARWTDVETLGHNHDTDTSFVRCLIVKGARHQIRVHLASLGNPIVGDALYGDAERGELRLHHQRIEFSGFSADAKAPWEFGRGL